MIHTTKKKLQLLFKKFGYKLFKLFYTEVNKFEKVENNSNSKITLSKIDDEYNYKVFTINNARVYTDTINDFAVIQNNKVLIGPSYQIRDTKFKNIENKSIHSPLRPKFRNKAETNIYFLSKRKFQSEKKQSMLINIKLISGIIILVVGGYILSN